jgi:hypothetical protein
MDDHPSPAPTSSTLARSVGIFLSSSVIAGLIGVASGALIAHVAPKDDYSWAGVAAAPLWFFLEILFEFVAGVPGLFSKPAKVAATIAVVGGFYAAYYYFKPVGT